MKKSFIKARRQSDQMVIQITSMVDIFMILLVFLLKSYGSGLIELTPTQGMAMPQASADGGSAAALKVEVTKNTVLLEGKAVATLGSEGLIPRALVGAFAEERRRQMEIAKIDPGVKPDPRVIMIADRNLPYSTIKSVLASAASNGYTDFKLAVVRTN